MSSPYEIARQQGYTDDEISGYLSQKDPAFGEKYQKAVQAGYQPQEVFQFYSQSQQPAESVPENINRQILRTGARGAETVLGAPRALGEFLESIVPEKLLKKGAEKVGLKEPVEKGLETVKKFSPYKLFPTSEQVRKNVTNKLFGEALEPKNEWEKKADDVVSDFTALALPFPGSKLKLLKPALLSLGGNIASEVVGHMGGTEKQKTFTKLGVILTGSLINPKGAENLKNSLYKDAAEALPADATVAAKPLENAINELESSLRKGGIAGSDKEALQKIADIRGEMQGAQIPIESLQRLKVKINEAKAGVYKQLEGNKPGIKSAKRNLERVGKSVDDALNLYGKQNPQWEAFYRPANEVHGAIEQSKRARNFIGKQMKKYGHHLILPALGIGHFGGPAAIGSAAAGAGIGAGALVGAEIAARIFKSPTLRKHYFSLVKSALKEDAVATRENLRKLEKELEKED